MIYTKEQYDEMSLAGVVSVTGDEIVKDLVRRGYDIDYPEARTSAILQIVDQADELASTNSIGTTAIAISFLQCLVKGLEMKLPEALNDRLEGRIRRS